MPGNQENYKRYMNQGHSAAWDMEWDEAVAGYSRALEEFPQSVQAMSSLGTALFETGAYAEALAYLKRVAEKSPDDPLPLEKMGQIFELQGKSKIGAAVALRRVQPRAIASSMK